MARLIADVAFAVSLVVTPAFVFFGFASIRWDIRQRGTWSPSTVRLVTLAMWGLIVVDGVAVALLVRPLPLIVLAFGLGAVQLRRQIVGRLAGTPDPRRQAGLAVQRVFDIASSPFRRPDADELHRELAALDQWVTPATFEFIQLARALMLHSLDGGSPDAPNARRWRERINAISSEWWPPASTNRNRSISRITRNAAKRWWLPLSLIAGFVIGSAVWVSIGPLRAAAAVALGWLVVWGARPLVVSAGVIGALVGLALATGLLVGECGSCDPALTVGTVAAISVVGLLFAWYLVASHRKVRPATQLRLVEGLDEPGGETDSPRP